MELTPRQLQVLDTVRARSQVQITELSEELGVSRETIRKDLAGLASRGLLIQVRGGAVSRGVTAETAYEARKRTNTAAKEAIAVHAAGMVEPGMTIYLDYGSTTYMLAQHLDAVSDLTCVTNALPIAALLSTLNDVTVIVPGGIVRSNESSLYGPMASRNLSAIHFDLGFFSAAGADATAGVTNHHMFESENSALALAHCRRSVFLVDGSKFGVVARSRTASIGDFDVVVSDSADVEQLCAPGSVRPPKFVIAKGT